MPLGGRANRLLSFSPRHLSAPYSGLGAVPWVLRRELPRGVARQRPRTIAAGRMGDCLGFPNEDAPGRFRYLRSAARSRARTSQGEEVMMRWVLGWALVLVLFVIMGLLNLGVWLLLPFHWLVRRASALARS